MANQRNEIYSRLKTLLAETLGADEDEITWDTNVYDDLNADVIEFHDEVMQLVEEEFSVVIPDDEVADLTTVRELVDYVAENT
ncbi:MAG TPA: acyl carrier protein [Chloroflexia bacterium]|nr:acyl carrier protein [Chloroflexia bacterium]